jgi:hypothetical protein
LLEAPCEEFDVAFVELEDWLAVTPLPTLWLPLPTFTPGLTLAPALRLLLLTSTLALRSTFGLALIELPDVPREGELAVPLVDEVPLADEALGAALLVDEDEALGVTFVVEEDDALGAMLVAELALAPPLTVPAVPALPPE